MKKLFLTFLSIIFIINGLVHSQQMGNASFYSKKLNNHFTSDGGKYHPDSLTCAHRSYPFGTILKVRNPKNNEEVIVKVTDRGPHHRKLMIDLSYCAAKKLDFIRAGIASVEITQLNSMPIKREILKPIPVTVSQINIMLEPVLINLYQFLKKKVEIE
jgi:rare lipoprotein A